MINGIARPVRAILVLAALIVVVLVAARRSPGPLQPGPLALRIAAAADLRFALDELTVEYRKARPTVALTVTYGSSGTLYAQILSGAPFDLFMSADVEYPRQLAKRGVTVPGTEFTYGIGRIVVWVNAGSPLDLDKTGIQVLADRRVVHVAMANPEHAPYGRAAEAAMRGANVYDAVKPKLVLGENVAQALQFVQSGAADAGIVALSLAVSPTVKTTGRYWAVPADLYPLLEQGGVVLRSDAADQARDFRAYLLGNAARRLLKQYGFDRPEN